MPSPRSFSGARSQIRIGGKLVGWAVAVQVDESLNMTAVDVLDDPYTQELELNSITVSGSASVVYMYGNSLAEAVNGQYPQGDKTKMILFKEAELHIVDSITGQTLFAVHRLKFTGRTVNVTREGVAMQNCTFRAISLQSYFADPGVT